MQYRNHARTLRTRRRLGCRDLRYRERNFRPRVLVKLDQQPSYDERAATAPIIATLAFCSADYLFPSDSKLQSIHAKPPDTPMSDSRSQRRKRRRGCQYTPNGPLLCGSRYATLALGRSDTVPAGNATAGELTQLSRTETHARIPRF